MQREVRSKRAYPRKPIVGVGGVVLRENELLLVRRGLPPSQGLWSLPGGAVELGEELATAFKGEIQEECSISIQVGPIVGVFDTIYRDPAGRVHYHYVLIDFLADYVAGNLVAGSDASEAAWVPFEKFPSFDMADGAKQLLGYLQSALLDLKTDRQKLGVLYGQIG